MAPVDICFTMDTITLERIMKCQCCLDSPKLHMFVNVTAVSGQKKWQYMYYSFVTNNKLLPLPNIQNIKELNNSCSLTAENHSASEVTVKPVLNWANVCSPEHTLDTSTNYDLFLNWTFSLPNMVQTVQTLLHSQLAWNEMQASARTCSRHTADSMIENVG